MNIFDIFHRESGKYSQFSKKYLNAPSVVLSVPVVGTVDVVVLLVLDAAADWVLGLADQPVRDEQRREGVWGEVEPTQVLLGIT